MWWRNAIKGENVRKTTRRNFYYENKDGRPFVAFFATEVFWRRKIPVGMKKKDIEDNPVDTSGQLFLMRRNRWKSICWGLGGANSRHEQILRWSSSFLRSLFLPGCESVCRGALSAMLVKQMISIPLLSFCPNTCIVSMCTYDFFLERVKSPHVEYTHDPQAFHVREKTFSVPGRSCFDLFGRQ